MAQRGVKAKAKLAPREPLSATPPAELGLSEAATAIFGEIAARLAVEGFASQADVRMVALAAKKVILIDRIEREIEGLEDLTVTTARGGTRLHPLIAELRTQEGKLADLFGALLLTPRSRSSVRLTEAQMRAAQQGGKSEPTKLEKFINKGKK